MASFSGGGSTKSKNDGVAFFFLDGITRRGFGGAFSVDGDGAFVSLFLCAGERDDFFRGGISGKEGML